MGFELVLFLVIATVAIFSAALMLVSTNAVHSALLLVTNFLCVAFLYLTLGAPFLAMIQITVYAGAIMVLFMFVIMLLGAEKLGGQPGKYAWVAPAAVALTIVFLITVFVTLVRGNIGGLQPVLPSPKIAVVHAVPGAPNVDIYLNNDRVAQNVEYAHATELTNVKAGDFNLLAFPSCTETDLAKCVDPITSGAAPLTALAVTLKSDTDTAYVIGGDLINGLSVISAPLDVSTLENEDQARLTVINALPGETPVIATNVNLSDPGNSPALFAPLNYGQVSETKLLERGTYTLQFQRGDERVGTLRNFVLRNKLHEVFVLLPKNVPVADGQPAQTGPEILRVEPTLRTEESFGSPQQIGLAMLSTYLLPFELVSLLLLVALVGAIILTHQEPVTRRVRQRQVVAGSVRRINQAIANQNKTSAPQIPGSPQGSVNAVNSESSAD